MRRLKQRHTFGLEQLALLLWFGSTRTHSLLSANSHCSRYIFTRISGLSSCDVAFFRQAASTGDGGEEIKKEDDQSSSCDEASSPSEEGVDVAASATIRIDDGGSDLTDRFKYKVNALMGVFDPPADQDNERASGHILNAMLSFPTRYTFHVVGRGDTSAFSESVRSTVQSVTGDTQVVMQVTPRGTRFTKIMIEANVYNSNMITNVYEQLGALEQTVMRF